MKKIEHYLKLTFYKYYLLINYLNVSYKFFSLVNFPSSDGIGPLKSLLYKYLFIIKNKNKINMKKIEHYLKLTFYKYYLLINYLNVSYKFCSLVNFPSSDGIGPLKSLLYKHLFIIKNKNKINIFIL